MQPLFLLPIVYALELEEGKYYIGISYDLNKRYGQHCSGYGSKWTRLYKPIDIMEVSIKESEKDMTLRYMRKYGYLNVRGAGWCKIELNSIPKPLEDELLMEKQP